MSKELHHPCKQTCSGWKQGYEKGYAAAEKDALNSEVVDALEDARDALSIAADNIEHYYENGCLPTRDELIQTANALKEANEVLSKLNKAMVG